MKDIETQKRELMKNEPRCAACHRHKFIHDLRIATLQDEENYDDDNDSYCDGPIEGEYYCGCRD
jgi:hypothetical protein